MVALVRQDVCPAAPRSSDIAAGTRPDAGEIQLLYEELERVSEGTHPRTARLLAAGRSKLAQKLLEEAGEVALEAVRRRPHAVVRESADLVYQLVVLWRGCGIAPDEVWGEMRRRADMLGIAEKLPKTKINGAPAETGAASGRAL